MILPENYIVGLVLVLEVVVAVVLLYLYLKISEIRENMGLDLKGRGGVGRVEKESEELARALSGVKELVNEARVFGENYRQELMAEAKKIFASHEREHEVLLGEVKQMWQRKLEELLTGVSGEVSAQVKDVSRQVWERLAQDEKDLGVYLLESRRKLADDVEKRRTQVFAEMESQVNQIVRSAAWEVLGKNLSHEEQVDLVVQGLEKARREHGI